MSGAAQESMADREWTLWSEQRAPNERGSYRYRATFPFLGLMVTAEWTEEMHLCGMGYEESEWWPLSSCHWNGYQRYITHKGLEWSPVREDDPDDIVWSGFDLLPCPFTGKSAKLQAVGQFIGAPLWRSECVWISSPGVPKRRWTDAKAMQAAWNTRAAPDLAKEVERLREALESAVKALKPFSETCEADVGGSDHDDDAFLNTPRCMARAPIRIGHLRKAFDAYWDGMDALSLGKGEGL